MALKPGSVIRVNEFLSVDDYIESPNRRFFALMQSDGNFVVYKGQRDGQRTALWATNTTGPKGFAIVQGDGNFVVYKGTSPKDQQEVWWATNKYGPKGKFFASMQDDGNFVVYKGTSLNDQQEAWWATKPLNNWMAGLNNAQSIADVSIPGTHDSGALRDNVAQCQSLSITEQLGLGIRFLDLRINHNSDGDLRITHGGYDQDNTFDDVQKEVLDFLNVNRHEFVLMHVQIYKTPSNEQFNEKFSASVARFQQHWFFESRIPKVKDVRKRMVLIRAYDDPKGWSSAKGIPCNAFNHDGLSSSEYFCSQNRWSEMTQGPKRTWIEDVYGNGKDKKFFSRDKFLLNFVSYDHPTMRPKSCAAQMNLDIYNFIRGLDDKKERLGVMATDFAGWVQAQDSSGNPIEPYQITPKLSQEIISHNVL